MNNPKKYIISYFFEIYRREQSITKLELFKSLLTNVYYRNNSIFVIPNVTTDPVNTFQNKFRIMQRILAELVKEKCITRKQEGIKSIYSVNENNYNNLYKLTTMPYYQDWAPSEEPSWADFKYLIEPSYKNRIRAMTDLLTINNINRYREDLNTLVEVLQKKTSQHTPFIALIAAEVSFLLCLNNKNLDELEKIKCIFQDSGIIYIYEIVFLHNAKRLADSYIQSSYRMFSLERDSKIMPKKKEVEKYISDIIDLLPGTFPYTTYLSNKMKDTISSKITRNNVFIPTDCIIWKQTHPTITEDSRNLKKLFSELLENKKISLNYLKSSELALQRQIIFATFGKSEISSLL